MTARDRLAVIRFCRADKRANDRALAMVRSNVKPSTDTAFVARVAVAARRWDALPHTIKRAVARPEV